jgi:hypothetical protein
LKKKHAVSTLLALTAVVVKVCLSFSNTGYAGLHIHEPSKDDFFQITKVLVLPMVYAVNKGTEIEVMLMIKQENSIRNLEFIVSSQAPSRIDRPWQPRNVVDRLLCLDMYVDHVPSIKDSPQGAEMKPRAKEDGSDLGLKQVNHDALHLE